MADIAKGYPISLYQKDIKIIKDCRKEKGFKGDSQTIQYIIDFYDKNHKKTMIKNLLVFIGYPAIINIILMVIARTLLGMHEDMYKAGIPFEPLRTFALNVNLIAIGWFAFFAMVIFLVLYKAKQESDGG